MIIINKHIRFYPELKTLEWWISGLRLNPLFFLISRLNIAWKTYDFRKYEFVLVFVKSKSIPNKPIIRI